MTFWALYGQGFSIETLTGIANFGAAHMTVIALEPLVDLAVLAGAKATDRVRRGAWLEPRLFSPA